MFISLKNIITISINENLLLSLKSIKYMDVNHNIVYYILIGTETVLNACKEQNVQHLIYCSSLSVYYGPEEVIRGTDTSVKPPSKLYFNAYASTKVAAQKMVLVSDGFQLNNGLYYS